MRVGRACVDHRKLGGADPGTHMRRDQLLQRALRRAGGMTGVVAPGISATGRDGHMETLRIARRGFYPGRNGERDAIHIGIVAIISTTAIQIAGKGTPPKRLENCELRL